MSGMTHVTGVFGYPVGHSKSPVMHNAAFRAMGLDYAYVPFSVQPDDLERAVQGIRALGIIGVNLTIPHKEQVIDLLDWVSEDAKLIRSVNTIHNCDGVLKGYSTDGAGLISAIESCGKSAKGSKTVVIGAGGSSRATVHALASEGAKVVLLNRTLERAIELAEKVNECFNDSIVAPFGLDDPAAESAVKEADLLVNCTPVGMHPNPDAQPIPSDWLHAGLFVYDQIYKPVETRLLKAARAVGATGANGVKMLVYQGALSFEIWTGCRPPVEIMETAVVQGCETG